MSGEKLQFILFLHTFLNAVFIFKIIFKVFKAYMAGDLHFIQNY
jgi:hypothetical protein